MVISGLSGAISSPGHPAMYPPNSACAWRIMVDEGQRIVIVFNALEIEHHAQCSYDYLQIRDGSEPTAPSLSKVCGNSMQSPVTSSGNNVLINFRSDTSVGGEGFNIEWSVECLPTLISCDYSATCINQSKTCDLIKDCNDWTDEGADCLEQGLGAYAALKNAGCTSNIENIVGSASLSTPNYPNFYIAGMDCAWTLSAAPESDGRYPTILASFDDPFGVACSAGSIQITTSDNNGVVESTTVCGDRAGPIAIGAEEGQTMTLTFSPSSVPIGQGYRVQWSLCPPDSLACPVTGQCFPPESGVLSCPSDMSTTQEMTTEAGEGTTAEGGPTSTPHISSTVRQDIVTTASSWDNSTMYTEGPDNTMCYHCEGTSRECMTGNGLGGYAIECQEDEACWVERIGEDFNVSYKRSCQPSCNDYWLYETCMTADGQAKMCKLCCTDDRCNTHILTGHNDPRGPAYSGHSGAEEILTSLGLVAILALAMCADILSLIT
ncbi:tolloid-like protein 2 [Branchiostoma floridae x Branchiostoma japonicum]